LYNGKFNDTLHELNENPIWRKLYNSEKPNKRMKDEELILRFLSLYYDFENYKKFSMILLKMTDEEFIDYEMRKYKYETK